MFFLLVMESEAAKTFKESTQKFVQGLVATPHLQERNVFSNVCLLSSDTLPGISMIRRMGR